MDFKNEKAIIGFFGGVYKQATTNLLAKLAALNPEVATQEQLDELYSEFNELSKQVTASKVDWDTEQAEADAIQAKYNMLMRAAEILNKKAEEAADPAQKTSLESSRDKQMAEIEALVPDVDREVREAKEAKDAYDDMHGFIVEFSASLQETERKMKQAQRDIKSAEISKKRAELRENTAKNVAGLKSQTLGSTAILDALQKSAKNTQQEADAANLRADLLKKKDLAEEDPNIKAALEEASGHVPTSNLTFAERMAQLKNRTAPVS